MISVGQKEVKPHPQPHPQPQAAQGGDDEFELSEEDLAAWAGSLVDDRQKKQGVCVWVWLLCGCGYCVGVAIVCVWGVAVVCECGLHVCVGGYEGITHHILFCSPQNPLHQSPNLVQNQSNR